MKWAYEPEVLRGIDEPSSRDRPRAAFVCVELALIQRFTLAAGGALYAVSFVLFSLLAWSAASTHRGSKLGLQSDHL